MIIAFLVSVAFSVDVSYMQLTRTKLRSATDAAARAAGEGLSRAQDMDYARQQAKDIAAANKVAGKPLLLDDSDIVFGHSDPAGRRRVGVHAGRRADQRGARVRPPHAQERRRAACRCSSDACSTCTISSRRKPPRLSGWTATFAWSSTAPAR